MWRKAGKVVGVLGKARSCRFGDHESKSELYSEFKKKPLDFLE